jgi:hypothetical protein
MRRKLTAVITAGLALVMTAVVAAPAAMAQTDKDKARQRDKNTMRNLGIGLGALAAHQAIKGKTTNALVLGAGAAYSAKKYEDQRKSQSRVRRGRVTYVPHYRNGRKVGYYRYQNGRRLGYSRVSSNR